jgi:hypothetical protein
MSAGGLTSIDGGFGDDTIFVGERDVLVVGGVGDDRVDGAAVTGDITFDAGDGLEYTNGDGSDIITRFRAGNSDDVISFADIPDIDLVLVGTDTQIHLGDGIAGNTGFSKGDLLTTSNNVVATDLTADNFQNTDFFLS